MQPNTQFTQGFPNQQATYIQGQQIGLDQNLLGQGFINQQGIPIQGQSFTYNQGIPAQGLPTQDFTQQGFNQSNFGTQGLMQPTYINNGGLDYSSSNLNTNIGTQDLIQPTYINNGGLDNGLNNLTTNIGTQGLTGGNFVDNSSNQGLVQPGFTDTTGLNANNNYENTNNNQEETYQNLAVSTDLNADSTPGTNDRIQGLPEATYKDADLATRGLNGDDDEKNVRQPALRKTISKGSGVGTIAGLRASKESLGEETQGISDIRRTMSIESGTMLGTNLVAHSRLNPGETLTPVNAGEVSTQPNLNTTANLPTDASLSTNGTGTTGQLDSNFRGTFTFKPLEGKFNSDKDVIGKMDPYCKIKIGFRTAKSSVAKKGGSHPVWNDVITIEKKHNEQFAKIKVKDQDKITFNNNIGEAKIPLNEVASKGKVNQWYPIYKKDKVTGEVLLEISFQPRDVTI